MAHIQNIPERKKIDPLAVVKDYATVPRLEYRWDFSNFFSVDSEGED
jgi:hypothetical protein